VYTPWFVLNVVIQKHRQTLKDIHRLSSQYSVHLSVHTNDVVYLMAQTRQHKIAKTHAKWPYYKTHGLIALFVVRVFKV
jgi:hypothetical protein